MMKTLQFGIEIETIGLGRERLARAIHEVVGGTLLGDVVRDRNRRTWRVVPDGSLSTQVSGEIVSPVLGYEDLEELQEVVRSVRRAGARVDATTGIHVHVSSPHLDAGAVARLAKLMHQQEPLIEQALQIHASRRPYCQPIDSGFLQRLEATRPTTPEQLNRAWYGEYNAAPHRYNTTRYSVLNVNSYFVRGTIEFRLFNSVLHAGKVKAYVQFALALTAKAIESRSVSSRQRQYNPATAKYDVRVFLLRLGLIGQEFKTVRLHLTAHLGGSAAWRGERRDRRQAAPAAAPAASGEAEAERAA